MGQYYYPINIETKEYLYSHDFKKGGFGVGLKLTEHSWIGNELLDAAEALLTPLGKWHKCKLVWGGDYADEEPNTENEEYPKGRNWHSIVQDEGKKLAPYEIDKFVTDNKIDLKEYPYIVNHTLKQYVDKTKLKPLTGDWAKGEEWIMHPLSLLTAEGNDRGGGDYREKYQNDFDRVGSWARHSISVEKEKPEGYEELITNFWE